MRINSLIGSLVTFSIFAFASCDRPTDLGPPVSPSLSALRSNTEHAALEKLTQAVALALRDPALRQRLKRDLRESRHTIEHKLSLQDYFEGPGRELVDHIAINQVTDESRVIDLIKAVRPLELYMPIDEHRETWTGGELLVAGQIGQSEAAFIYDTNGEAVEMDVEDVPTSSVPVLALVPVETDFTQELDPRVYRNTADLAGTSIGTWSSGDARTNGSPIPLDIEPCDPNDPYPPPHCEPPPPPPPPDPEWTWGEQATGIYITHLSIPDDHEGCCLKGDPEFEVHLHAPRQDPKTAEDLRCSGRNAPDTRSRFDMNGSTWSISTSSSSRRPILIADSVQQARFRSTYGEDVGMGIVAWEDDDTSCEVKADAERLEDATKAAAAAAPNAWAAGQDPNTQNILKALPGIINAVIEVASWLKSDDDLVGVSHKPSGICTANGHTGWRLTDNAGCVVLRAHKKSTT